MRKIESKNNWIKLTVIVLLMVLVASSASPVMIKSYNKLEEKKVYDIFDSPFSALDDPIYEWIDNFDNEQKIESSMSYDYELNGGKAIIKNTYPIWTDSSWECMVPITLTNNMGYTVSHYAIKLTISYDSDMNPDFHDIRFKHESFPTQWLDYWIEDYTHASSAIVWVNFPSLK